jgi:L-arabinose isomerase
MRPITVGLLPLYLKLYDDTTADARPGMERFLDTIVTELGKRHLNVAAAPVCRVAPEFNAAVKSFETAGVDAIVTLHLAYSPSLESAGALAGTRLPVIVLDTSPAWDFSPQQSPDEIMYNHGIHGVQDLCNLLIRSGKPFVIEAGHWEHSDVLERVAQHAYAARLTAAMRSARVGSIGGAFKGMGDFAVPAPVLRATIGMEVVSCAPAAIGALAAAVSEHDVEEEMAADMATFAAGELTQEAYRRTARVGLAVRQWIEQERLTAFTVNFMEASKTAGLPTMPFLEASKGMGRGIGYAGEGDALTAGLVGALASVYPDTSFTEMFCADWANDTIFLSHMGEMNVKLVAGKARLVEKVYSFIDTDNPVLAFGRFRGGPAVLVNLAPGPRDTYTLILVPVTMLDPDDGADRGADRMGDSIHGWFKPGRPVADLLAAYSRVGGTHHSALVYGDTVGDVLRPIAAFGEMMGWKVEIL